MGQMIISRPDIYNGGITLFFRQNDEQNVIGYTVYKVDTVMKWDRLSA